jgi:uncharacterized repeat protein (TIGR01451 family)/fimbrial isopeptide formation D2 family protein
LLRPVDRQPCQHHEHDLAGQPGHATLLSLTKTYIGPEDETATGPNYPHQYRIDVDIAPGQTIANLDVTDLLPNNEAFLSVVSSSPGGASVTSTPTVGAAANPPNNQLTVRFPSVTGGAGTSDASVTFQFFVPLDDANGNPVIAAADGNDAQSQNNASAQGTWTPIDGRDPSSPGNALVDGVGPEHTLTDKSIAIQKDVAIVNDVGAAGYSVGDTLEYTIQFQVSDYFAFQNVVVDDTLSDGQHYDATFQPTLAVAGNGFTLPAAAMNATNVIVAPNYTPADTAPNDGTTALQFRVSNELLTRGRPNGRWIGGCVPVAGTGGPTPNCTVYNDGATTATLKFRTVIQDRFSDTFPSGDPYVNSGDHLDNSVAINADLLSVANTNTTTGFSEVDDSATQVNIVFGNLSKSIYAINDSTSFATPVQITPGDRVTYRVQYDLASSDFENLKFVDNLPLPIFDALEIATFDSTFDATGAAPAAGHYKLGPADTYHSRPSAVSPGLTTNATDNSVTFGYGTYNDPGNQASAIDILFTVTVNDQPFADGLFLTNQVHETDGSTNGPQHAADSIIQLQLTEPALLVKKGAIGSNHTGATLNPPAAGPVAFSAPGSASTRWTGTINSTNLATTPVDSNISGVDSGDLVSFAIVVENKGASQKGAFDVTITDTIPLGLIVPPSGAGLNMRVTYGDGTPLTFIGLTNGAGAAQDIFTSGIRLDDPALVGACQVYNPTNGHNIIIITYDLQVDPSAPSGAIIPNRASITNYAGTEGGPNFVPVDHPTDSADTTIASPGLNKQLTGTSISNANNSNTQAVIGELATYTLTISVPEGLTSNAQIADTLDAGLAFVDIISVTSSAGVNMSTPIGVGASPANVTIGAGGRTITFNHGNLTNSNTNNAQVETITIVYDVVVLDVASNQAGTPLNNSAALTWANGSLPAVSAANVTVIEPTLTITSVATPTTGDAGDTITFDLTVANTAAGTTDAYDISLSDLVPAGMTYVSGSLVNVSGPAATLSAVGAPTLTAAWATLAPGGTSVIRFQATLNGNVTPGQILSDNAVVQWTSLSGAPGQLSTYNTTSTERTGAGGVDDYNTSDSDTVTVNSVALTKSIVTTSEAHTSEATSPRPLAIGEIVRYRLAVQLPEGVAPDFQINDNLPTGLTFLNDGTARVAFVSNGGISSASAQAGAIPAVPCTNDLGSAADLISLPQAQVDCTPADANISSNPTSNVDTYNSGTDVRFKLGTLTNADSDAGAEFAVVEFNALLDNSVAGSNDAGDTRTNTFAAFLNATTQNGPTSGGVQVRVVEPLIPFNAATDNKTVVPATGDAGDVVTYTLVYTNANGANNTDAYDTRVLDAVPPAAILDLGSISVTANAPCAAPTFINNSAGNNIDIMLSHVAPNCRITITYQATLTASVVPGQLLINTANLTYTSLPGANGTTVNTTGSTTPGASGTDTGERNGSGVAPNDYLGSDQAQVTVFVPAPAKSLVCASEAHTSGSNLAIGEIARYRLVVTVGEGSSPNFLLRDNLPAGLTFLDDGTAKVALVSTDPGLTSNTLSGAGLLVLGNEGTVSGVTPTFVLPASAISGGTGAGGTFQNGDDPIFSLGNLTNTDNDTTQELVVVEFNALTGNVIGNQAGTTLDNTFDVLVNGSVIATSNVVAVNVVEASITDLTEIATTAPGDAGDTVVFQLTYSNGATGANRADAFDINLIDSLGSNLNLLSVSVTTPAGSNAADTSTLGTGGVVRVAVDQLQPAVDIAGPVKSVTIIVTARVVGTTPNGLTISNNAGLTYTSLPGANGTTSNCTGSSTTGTSGASTGERNGSGAPLNDYIDSSNASVTLTTPAVQKLAPTPAIYTIGEDVTYDIRVSLPEGATPALTVTDTLPAGMGYVSHSVVTTAVASSGHLATDYNGALNAPTFTNASGVLTFGFGAVQTNGGGPANGTSNNQFLVRVVARVLNVASNQQGTTLVNSAGLSYTNPNTGTPVNVSGGSQSISLVEPALVIAKHVTPPSANVGDTVTFQIAITNTATVAAHDVALTDTVPAGLTYVAGSISIVSGPAGTTDDSGAPNLIWSFPIIPPGATAVVAFDARLDGSDPSTIGNTADVTWTSTPGANAEERTGVGAPLNDYSASDSTTLQTSSYIFDKRLVSPADRLAGVNDTVRFSITVTNTGATLLATVPLTDSFDATFLQFLSASVAPDTTAAGQLTWNNVGPLAIGANRTILIDFKTLAVTDSQPGRVTINRTGISGAQDSNGTTLISRTSSAPVAIGAPDLQVTLTDGRTSAGPGDTQTYTIFLTNTGTYTATGVVITETVPLNTSCAGGSVAWVAQGGGIYAYALPSPLGIGQGTSLTFVVTVDSAPLPAGANTIDDTVSVGDDGAHGPDATPANNSATDIDTLAAAPDLVITKSDGGVSTTPGGTVVYTLSYTNTGSQDATGVVITETVPANSSFDAGGSTAGWTCTPNNSAGSVCTLAIGKLAAGASGSATFAVVVANPVPAGAAQIANTATIADDSSNGPTTPADNTGSDTTPVAAAPDLQLLKSDAGASVAPGGTIDYTLTYTNTGNRGASGVVITETVPLHTSFNAGASTPGWVCKPNGSVGSTCTFAVGIVAGGGASGSVTFAVTVDTPLPAGVTQIANSAVIGDDNRNGIDTTTADNASSDTTPVRAAPDLRLLKRANVISIAPGAPIAYTLTYTNVGVIAATGVVITETVPFQTKFNAPASMPTLWSCADGAAGGTTCTTAIPGAVAGGGGAGRVRFTVAVNSNLASSTAPITNTAVIGDDGTNGADLTPNNNVASVATLFSPTAIVLSSFTATAEGDAIVVRWRTSAELNTWGFHLYRSADGERSHAVRVTPELILGRGRDQGAAYEWRDSAAEQGMRYTYWLEEVELDGATHEYGPASAARGPASTGYRIFVPFIRP